MAKKKTDAKFRVSVEMLEDGTYDVRYEINDKNVTDEEIASLAEFVDQVLNGTLEWS